MSNKSYNDISYRKSQSDRLYELLNAKKISPCEAYCDIYVSEGGDNGVYTDDNTPYFNFYLRSDGTQQFISLTLDINKTYRFHRLDKAQGSPFFIHTGNDINESNNISINGDGSTSSGIEGSQDFTLRFNPGFTMGTELKYFQTSQTTRTYSFTLINSNESKQLSRKQGMCYTVDGKPTSILQTSNAVSSSDKNSKLKTQIITSTCNPCTNYTAPWNNQSDRIESHIVTNNISNPQNRPGGMSAAGSGVDIKHGSYERYIAKLKL